MSTTEEATTVGMVLDVLPTREAADGERAQAVRAGVRVERVTIGWMVVEAAVAVGAGVLPRSVLLTAFGIDSVIELVAGGVLLWRLLTEARGWSGRRTVPPGSPLWRWCSSASTSWRARRQR